MYFWIDNSYEILTYVYFCSCAIALIYLKGNGSGQLKFAQALSEICHYWSKPQVSFRTVFVSLSCAVWVPQRVRVTSKGDLSMSFGENQSGLSHCSVQSLCFIDESAMWKTLTKYTRHRGHTYRQTPRGRGVRATGRWRWMYISYYVAQMVKNPPAMQGTRFNPWVGKIPWRK